MERRPLQDALSAHQHDIGLMLDEAEAILASDDPARAALLVLLRWQLARRLREYQAFKHTLLFDPLCNGDHTAVARLACAMKARCIALDEAYAAHVAAWPDEIIGDRWPTYAIAAAEMILALRQHLAREARDAEQLLWARIWFAPGVPLAPSGS